MGTSMAKSMETPTATLMVIAAAEIEAAVATEKLVAKAGGNYKAAAERHRQQSTKKGDGNGNGNGDGGGKGDGDGDGDSGRRRRRRRPQ